MLLVEDKSAVLVENLDHAAAVVVHLGGSGLIEHGAGVASAAPEGDVPSEFPLEHLGVHLIGRGLHGVENVVARVDEIGDDGVEGAAGMEQGLHAAVGVDVLVELGMVGLEEGLILLTGHEHPRIHTQIVPEPQDVHDISHGVADLLQSGQVADHELLHQGLHTLLVGVDVHIEFPLA